MRVAKAQEVRTNYPVEALYNGNCGGIAGVCADGDACAALTLNDMCIVKGETPSVSVVSLAGVTEAECAGTDVVAFVLDPAVRRANFSAAFPVWVVANEGWTAPTGSEVQLYGAVPFSHVA